MPRARLVSSTTVLSSSRSAPTRLTGSGLGDAPVRDGIPGQERVHEAAVRLPQGVRVGRDRHDGPLQEVRLRVPPRPVHGHALDRYPAYGRRPEEALVPGVLDALRERVVGQELEVGDDPAPRVSRDGEGAPYRQSARGGAADGVVGPHHHRVARVVLGGQPLQVELRRLPDLPVCRDGHAVRVIPQLLLIDYVHVHSSRPALPFTPPREARKKPPVLPLRQPVGEGSGAAVRPLGRSSGSAYSLVLTHASTYVLACQGPAWPQILHLNRRSLAVGTVDTALRRD